MIKKITEKERNNIFADIKNLILDQSRFSLDNLLTYSVSNWLSQQNPTIIQFIEILTHNTNNEEILTEEKLFKQAVAVEAIYGSRCSKYVSAINLVASAIKYSISRSKTIVDIDNHIIGAESYTKFINWLESLTIEQSKLPSGLLFLAFDNEQKGQKNYLDRGYNTVVFHTVTSFIAFNYGFNNNIQATIDPWLYSELTPLQYEELYDLTFDMKSEIHKELVKYLSTILKELCLEKKQATNSIDNAVCPKCNAKLPTISEINQQHHNSSHILLDITNTIDKIEKPLILRHHSFNKQIKSTNTSYTYTNINQESILQNKIQIPQLFVPDPLGVNPNSISNIRMVFKYIEEITGIKDNIRKWAIVTCDGIPYHRAQKIKREFPWLILIPGPLYEEMNMLKSFVELNWDIDIKIFAQCQGYRTENQKKNPSVEDYLIWAQNQTDATYQLKYEQIFYYLQAIINFRTGVRTNRFLLKMATRRTFAPIW
ncbi:hypothetical protein Glove_28g32 [Diversispora epigaea]|uniref:Uncharacterized protein n=1 Tax=Diversispora epigaea TaxID=1348612 RepID=A0A397JKV3_9GLOM|nr:hypothetical protein Glove_28g32 [Diversispora epigaea]